jgi:hypothetical protein
VVVGAGIIGVACARLAGLPATVGPSHSLPDLAPFRLDRF